MDLMHYAEQLRFGSLHIVQDEATGLKGIVALHNLQLGPAIGGCRCIPYQSGDAAMRDAMRLARGMSYKAAISGLPHGGGKSVIMRPASLEAGSPRREALFEAFGRFIDSLGGQYLVAEDSGTSVADMDVIRTQTRHVLGTGAEHASGDPSPMTAYGTRRGLQAAVAFKLGRHDLEGVHVAIQGLGNVGMRLAEELHALGARLTVTDVVQSRVSDVVERLGAVAVPTDAIFDVEADVFAPCALGAILNDDTIGRLKVSVIAGAANNQLAEDRHGLMLKERGILYAPDYAINAGGLINVASEFSGYDPEDSHRRTTAIYDTMMGIFDRAMSDDVPTHVIADRIVEEKLGWR